MARLHALSVVQRRQLQAWEQLLSRPMGIDLEPCAYCGLPASTIDHVPPQSVRAALVAQNIAHRYKFVEVPACRECNSAILGPRGGWTVVERRNYVKKALRRRYAAVLRIPDWTDRELSEMAAGLAQYIQVGINARELTRQRIEFRGATY